MSQLNPEIDHLLRRAGFGASPADVAKTVASPLERHLGQIASVTEMTSASTLGSASVVLQFEIGRDINGAARDVQAAINAARADLPTGFVRVIDRAIETGLSPLATT